MEQDVYDSSGLPHDEAPANSGSYFFSFGGAPAVTGVSEQRIDLHVVAAQIDAGQLRYRASGAFGGGDFEDDDATLTLRFWNESDYLEDVVLGGFTAADRGSMTKLIPDSKSGLIPVGSRYVDAILTGTLVTGDTNEAYADDLSLVVPQASQGSSCAAALAALAIAA